MKSMPDSLMNGAPPSPTSAPDDDAALRKSSAAWWERTREDPQALLSWLRAQHLGEVTAAGRIRALRDGFAAPGSAAHRTLTAIARQEDRHGRWVAELLRARGLLPTLPAPGPAPAQTPTSRPGETRYWAQTLPGIHDLESGAAVGAHAERMRLWRIEVIAADPRAPEDIRAVFGRILPEERFHERAFREMAGAAALRAAAGDHERGLQVLGLSP